MNCKRCVLYHPHQETSHLYAIPEISQSIDAYHCTEEYLQWTFVVMSVGWFCGHKWKES
uniref:Uncharacterized protein n=1 Tax=Parascaris univalens TaxID=6257 RepID=A0A915CC74_PARUN